ncbi:hypothetical protein NLU13_4960 [Sarocladium strictum]|uniref:Major facilitator superfamily (MFS) profile domain-containing protein n=1 Tax=Sarocladium strictum TaxID=5046 RepID=A0AA39GJW4_SARSR|nr:hypothetical protein NLU13_4960 [Sarocladium strictum]
MLFGFDTATFGGILANQGFINQFGEYNPETDAYAINPTRTALVSSLAFIGKFTGCLFAGELIEKLGHRKVFHLLSVISVVGVIGEKALIVEADLLKVEITAADAGAGTGRLPQFIVGRIIVYISIGLVEVNVTTYQAEIVPPAYRGLVVISLQLFLNMGALLATGVNKALSTTTDGVGWKTVTGIQFVFPVYSPRWLLSRDRENEAIANLQRLRPPVYHDACAGEIEAIRHALQADVHKAPWRRLFSREHVRRTIIVMVFYFFQQTTGQAFVSTYQTVFYRNHGYAAQAFTYPVITSGLIILAVVPAMYLVDRAGCGLWLSMLAGLGSITNKSAGVKSTIVASFMLYAFSYNMGGASIPYLLGGEIPNSSLREKTQSFGAAWNVLWAFITNFVLPYLIRDLGFGVGWIFGGSSLLAFLFTFFFLPETKGRALEEVDAIFAVPFNPFRPRQIVRSEVLEHIASQGSDRDTEAMDKKTVDHVDHRREL